MNDFKILGSYWYTNMQFSGQIGFVAIATGPDEDNWKCYCGIAFGEDETADQQIIAARGAKVIKDVAVAHFPALDPDKFVF